MSKITGERKKVMTGNRESLQLSLVDAVQEGSYTMHSAVFLGMAAILFVVFPIFREAYNQSWSSTGFWIQWRYEVLGLCTMVLVLGAFWFPRGPFLTPHPIFWRLAFGLGVLYECYMLLLLILPLREARSTLSLYIDHIPRVPHTTVFAEDCAFTMENLWNGLKDKYAMAHFTGWIIKGLMIRDWVLCFCISLSWEVIENSFVKFIPFMRECWWDSYILDVCVCNALGMLIGTRLVKFLGWRQYRWRTGKLTRWGRTWRQPGNMTEFFSLTLLLSLYHISELQAFLLKHTLQLPAGSVLHPARLLIWTLITSPAMAEIYDLSGQVNQDTFRRWNCKIPFFTMLGVTVLLTETAMLARHLPTSLIDTPSNSIDSHHFPVMVFLLLAWLAVGYSVWREEQDEGGHQRAKEKTPKTD